MQADAGERVFTVEPGRRTTASATARRTSRMALFSRVGCTRLVSRMTNRLRSGSIHIDVPVNPVWPKERGPNSDPAEEFSLRRVPPERAARVGHALALGEPLERLARQIPLSARRRRR